MLQADFTISKAVKMSLRVKGSKYLDYQDLMKCLLTNFRESKNSYANQANWEKPKEVKKDLFNELCHLRKLAPKKFQSRQFI